MPDATREPVRTAAKFADRHGLGIALGATLHTLDQRLAAAGPALGVRVELLPAWSTFPESVRNPTR